MATAIAVAGAAVVLVTIVLPAEYGLDATGVGRVLGLTALRGPVRKLEIADVLGGNEKYREVEIPDFGEPVPLPNPAVHQDSNDYWVRYKEQQEGSGNNGSLTAPFTGEHGWYWLNYNDFPVAISLTVTGFYDDIVDYGIFGSP
jgi:hypothetical protein